MATNSLSAKQIQRNWHLIDAKGQILGRMATNAAPILSGKKKARYVPYLDTGDYVVVTNASQIKVTGKKMTQKRYVSHSGYPGGLKVKTLTTMMSDKPEEVIRHAVKGMLPKTKLGNKMIKKLHIFAGEEHPFKKQLGQSEPGNQNQSAEGEKESEEKGGK